MKKLSRMKDDERCLDCDLVLNDPEFEGHSGDPFEPYDEGFHICGKEKPRVVKWLKVVKP